MYDFVIPTVSPEGSVTITPDRIDASFGDNVSFNCTSLAGPDNQYQWRYTRSGETVGNDSVLLLTFVNITVGGAYECTISNIAGYGKQSAFLNSELFYHSLVESIYQCFLSLIFVDDHLFYIYYYSCSIN